MEQKNNFWKRGLHLSLFLLSFFVICFIWFYLRGGRSELQELHDNLFALTFFGWDGMNFTSFVLGAIQTFVWGYILSGLWFVLGCCCKSCNKK